MAMVILGPCWAQQPALEDDPQRVQCVDIHHIHHLDLLLPEWSREVEREREAAMESARLSQLIMASGNSCYPPYAALMFMTFLTLDQSRPRPLR
jgi:hypothetical protein